LALGHLGIGSSCSFPTLDCCFLFPSVSPPIGAIVGVCNNLFRRGLKDGSAKWAKWAKWANSIAIGVLAVFNKTAQALGCPVCPFAPPPFFVGKVVSKTR